MRALLLMAALLLPMAAMAQERLSEGRDWRNCSMDEQCVMIEGVCGKTAVNRLAQYPAMAYYRERQAEAECVERFWEPKEQMPRCRLGSCETIPKQGSSK